MREVVGVALFDGGRVLAARRVAPPELAGCWELPGGKVESGERREDTAVREVAEELDCAVVVTGRLGGRSALGEDLELVAVTARLVEGDPVPREHDAVRWLRADQLDEVDWVQADRVFLPGLRDRLGRP